MVVAWLNLTFGYHAQKVSCGRSVADMQPDRGFCWRQRRKEQWREGVAQNQLG